MGSKHPDTPSFITSCWHAVALFFIRLIFSKLNRIEILGRENIPGPEERSVMILSNHISAIDPFIIVSTALSYFSKVPWKAPAKEELFRFPLLKQLLLTWGAFPVRRGKRDTEAMKKMVEMLNESLVVIYPEGTRSRDGNLLRGRSGVGKIIWEARPRKIVPVVVEGTEKILAPGQIIPRVGKTCRIYYGKPVDLSGYYSEAPTHGLTQEMTDEIIATFRQMQKEIGFKYSGKSEKS